MSKFIAGRTYLMINENIRLVRFDSLNLAIEMLCEVTSKKKALKKWNGKQKDITAI